MAEVFLSYAKTDRALVEIVAEALIAEGFSIWWDQALQVDGSWSRQIEVELKAAGCVLTLWTPASIEREFVRNEGRIALAAGKIVQLSFDGAEPPLGFQERQYQDLTGWRGDRNDRRWRKVVDGVKSVLRGDEPAQGARTAAMAQSEPAARVWRSIAQSLDGQDYERFLDRYPEAPQAGLAKEHLRQIEVWTTVDRADPAAIQDLLFEGPFDELAAVIKGALEVAKHWDSISRSINPEDYEAHVTRFPSPVEEARARIEMLNAWRRNASNASAIAAFERAWTAHLFPMLETEIRRAEQRARHLEDELRAEALRAEAQAQALEEQKIRKTSEVIAENKAMVRRRDAISVILFSAVIIFIIWIWSRVG